MKSLPIKLKNCPIVETILEIRFSSKLPQDAVFGVIYQALQKSFSTFTVKPQPILQLPSEVRNIDPNMKYQPTYQLINENLSIGICAKSIVFSNKAPYKGWQCFKEFILSAVELIYDSSVIDKIERIGLRYINIIDSPLADATNLNISLCGESQNKNDVSVLRLEKHLRDAELIVFQLNNNVFVSINNAPAQKKSMIDIDSIKNINANTHELIIDTFSDILETLHKNEKEHFFGLLRDDYLKQLTPEF
ncbi:MAG: TIGR04255 family protein [Treponema sp.]|uniref:TIGR04255 family protein n=1 Tax=Treponema sp. TaxID=166 RepID=UPI0025EA6AB0|nr:TIGR04255 family protein [Treponema sp.]MBQ9282178.1 TIGR04255 family protein [Treponema sp.]MBR1723372.1 TIGR04255 family protein [Treponema sp.]